jgi:signal transduction histidine kinase
VTVKDVGTEHAQRLHREQVERLASIGELLSSVAHELNNPLTTVLGYAEILIAEEPPADLRDDLERIRSEATRCRRIVGNLLDLSRAEAPRMRGVQLSELLAKVVEFRSYPAQIAQIRLTAEVDPLAPQVRGDFHRLAQALLNLVTNAEYALDAVTQDREITLRARVTDEQVELAVEDNGPGVPDEMLEAIFQPFYTTKPRGKGTGLGLSLARATAELHGGTIRAERSPAGGARIVITFPTSYA